jgi:glycosyltransferase involved in cell wall biosynthesis
MRVVHVNCVIDAARRAPADLLAAWPTLSAVADAAARAGAEVTVLQASHFSGEYQQRGVTYRFIAEPRWRRGNGAGIMPWRIGAAIRRERPDVVHFNGLDFPFHVRAACAAGAPVLLQDHASRAEGRSARFRRWGHEKVAGIAFTARAQAEPFLRERQLPASAKRFAVPESSSHFTPGDRIMARCDSGVHGTPALLWIGHLDANKDPLTLLRAVRIALAVLPDLQLWCAFVGTALLPEVEALLRADERLAAHVHLLGTVPHAGVETLCRAADLFVSTSRREGSGYALIEAMACGATPVVSDIPSFRALTGDGAVGALVPVGDAEALAAAIIDQAGRPREAARAAVRGHFERHLTFHAIGAQLMAAYRAIVAPGGRP